MTSQFSAHNARKCQDRSENGDEEEAEDGDEHKLENEHEDELEDELEHEEHAGKRRLQLCLEMQTKLCLWKVT